MKLFKETLIVFSLCYAGRIISSLLPFTFPEALIALFLLLLLLATKVIKEDDIEILSGFFLANMAFFFVPATVKVIENLEILLSAVWPIVIISIVSTLLTFFAAAKAVDLTEFLIHRKKGERKTGEVKA